MPVTEPLFWLYFSYNIFNIHAQAESFLLLLGGKNSFMSDLFVEGKTRAGTSMAPLFNIFADEFHLKSFSPVKKKLG